jgi:two-component system cell cycle sensor histidine kinase/response regulator CckA
MEPGHDDLRERIRELEAANEVLRQREQILAAELDTLQQLATVFINAQGMESLYQQILDSTVAILQADFGSIQVFYPERGTAGELRLVSHRGFSMDAANRWEWVCPATRTTCGEALRTGGRVVVPDVRNCAFMSGSVDVDEYLDVGILAVQTTPLVSRSGALLGMISTHWRKPQELSQSELRVLDILARLAADSIDRSRADDSLRKALEQLQVITEHMTCGVLRCSSDLRYLWANRTYASWLKLTPEQVVGRPIVDVVGPDAYRTILPHMQKVLSGDIVVYETQLHYSAGMRWIHAVGVPTKSRDQTVDGWIAVLTDVTDARRSQEESFTRQKLESVGTLARGIAHDFNNLLGGVLAQAELGLSEWSAGSSPQEELNTIRNAAIRGSEIVRQLMIYAGKESGVAGPVDVTEIVKEMIELLRVSVSKHARLETNLGQALPAVWANAAQVQQIVMNLITNASEAVGDRDGVIRLTTRHLKVSRNSSESIWDRLPEADYLQLEITDTGCGMSPEIRAKVFDPFFTTKASGHGLGLSVVDGIVRDFGGAIHVSSEPGQGATFRVMLPCAKTAANAAAIAAGKVAGANIPALVRTTCTEQSTVLVVEDEDTLRHGVVRALRREGFLVLEASNGSAAIDLLRAHDAKLDVMLLDITLPGASCDEILAASAQTRPDIKVVLTSAYGEEVVAPLRPVSQVSAFIRKPFKLADLVQTLRSALKPAVQN